MKSDKKTDIFRIPISQWKLCIFLVILVVVLNTLGLGCMCGSDTDDKDDGEESIEDQISNAAEALGQIDQTLCGTSILGSTGLCGGDGSSDEGITNLCVNCPEGDAGNDCRQVCSDVLAPTIKATKLAAEGKFTYSYEFSMSVSVDTVYYLSLVTDSGTKKEVCSGTSLAGSFAQCAKASEEMDVDYSKICLDYWQGEEQKNKCEDIEASSAPVVDAGGITGGEMTGPGEFTINQGEEFTLTIPVTDPDCSEAVGCFTFSATSSPQLSSNFHIDQMTGKITFTPLQEDVGDHTVTISIVDKESHKTDVIISLHIIDVNDAPEMTLNDITFPEDSSSSVNLKEFTNDPDGTSEFTFTVTTKPDSKLIIQIIAGVANITAATDWNGEEEVEFTATDGTASSTKKIKVIVTPSADAPRIDPPIAVIVANEDFSPINIDLKTNVKDDIDTVDKITFALGEYDTTMVTATLTGSVLKIEPMPDRNGNVEVPIKLTDSEGNEGQYPIKMNIKPVNDAPIVSDISDITLSGNSSSILKLADIIRDNDNNITDIRIAFRYNAPEIKITYNPADQTAKFEMNGVYPPSSKMVEIVATDFGATGAKFVNVVWT